MRYGVYKFSAIATTATTSSQLSEFAGLLGFEYVEFSNVTFRATSFATFGCIKFPDEELYITVARYGNYEVWALMKNAGGILSEVTDCFFGTNTYFNGTAYAPDVWYGVNNAGEAILYIPYQTSYTYWAALGYMKLSDDSYIVFTPKKTNRTGVLPMFQHVFTTGGASYFESAFDNQALTEYFLKLPFCFSEGNNIYVADNVALSLIAPGTKAPTNGYFINDATTGDRWYVMPFLGNTSNRTNMTWWAIKEVD